MIDELRESIQRRRQEPADEAARLRAALDRAELFSPPARTIRSAVWTSPSTDPTPHGHRRAAAGETRRVVLTALQAGRR